MEVIEQQQSGAEFNGGGFRIPPAPKPQPVEITAPASPEPTPEPTPDPVVPATTETVIPETTVQTPAPEPVQAPTPAPAEMAPKPAEVSLEEVLKKADRKEVFKLLGADEFDIDFIDNRKNGGDPYKYLEVKTRDWNKMTDLEVLKHDLRQKYPTLDADQFELLAEQKIAKPYKLGEEFADEREKAAAELMMKIDADEKRKLYSEADKAYVIPGREPDKEVERLMAQAQQAKQDFIDMVTESEITKALKAEARVTAGEGEYATTIPADPAKILDYVTEEGKFFTLFNDEKGQLDLKKLYKTIAFAMDQAGYDKTLVDRGKSLGVKSEVEDIHHIPKETITETSTKKETLHEAFLKRGVERPL